MNDVKVVSDMPDAVRRVVPTIEAARGLGMPLPDEPPLEVRRLAVLRVACEGTFRKTWPEHPEMPPVESTARLIDVIVPTSVRTAEGLLHVERQIEAVVPLVPDAPFECKDLRPVAEVSAYRGARRQQDPRFHGLDFEDAIDLAKRATDDFLLGKGRLLSWRIRAWGWPLLWLRWPGGAGARPRPLEIVLIAHPEGTIERIASDEEGR